MNEHKHHTKQQPVVPNPHAGHGTHADSGNEPVVHRGDLADPDDVDHQAMTAEMNARHSAHSGHADHAGHDKHAGHSVEMFKSRFWLSVILSLPVLFWSEMIQEWLGYTAPEFSGSDLIPAVFGAIVFVYGGTVFLRGGWQELRDR